VAPDGPVKKLAQVVTLSMPVLFFVLWAASAAAQEPLPTLPVPDSPSPGTNPPLPPADPNPPLPAPPPPEPVPVAPPVAPVAPPPVAPPEPPTPPPPAAAGGGTGFRFGLRSGATIPFGERFHAYGLNELVAGGIPLWLDVGYRLFPSLYVGVYLDYAFLFEASNVCTGGDTCSFHRLRFGAMGAYHLAPGGKLDPWGGLGIGYESVAGTVGSSDFSNKGLELFNAQIGVDYKFTPNIRVGPFVAFSLGEFMSATNGSKSNSIPDKGFHEWLTIGLRGAYDL